MRGLSNRWKIPWQKWWKHCFRQEDQERQRQQTTCHRADRTRAAGLSSPGWPVRCFLIPLQVAPRISHSLRMGLCQFSSVQSFSHVWLFATPWTTAHQPSLSIVNSQSLPKFMSITSVMPSNYLILCHPLLLLPSIFPSIRVFSNESASGGQSIGASASVLPVNIQDWFTLGLIGWISLKSKGLSRVFSNTTVQKHQFSAQLSL